VRVNRPAIALISILMASFLLVAIVEIRSNGEAERMARSGAGIDGSGHVFYCGSGPVGPINSDGMVVLSDNSVVEGGHSYATTEPGGRGVCIRPPTPSP
jgi:hypothetical protein